MNQSAYQCHESDKLRPANIRTSSNRIFQIRPFLTTLFEIIPETKDTNYLKFNYARFTDIYNEYTRSRF